MKAPFDVSLGAVAATSPLWVTWLETGSGIVLAIGGVVLVLYRIALAHREWKQGRQK